MTLNELRNALLFLYPDADELKDWVIFDDGTGAKIAEWNRVETIPEEKDLIKVSKKEGDDAKDKYKFKKSFIDSTRKDTAIIKWIAEKHGITYEQALVELETIFKDLNK